MKLLRHTVLALSLTAAGPLMAADCTAPAMPELPNGETATMEEMIAGQTAVKAFQSDAQAYRACLEAELGTLKASAAEGDEAAAKAFSDMTADYNASVADEEKVAGDFNNAIRAYKAANPS